MSIIFLSKNIFVGATNNKNSPLTSVITNVSAHTKKPLMCGAWTTDGMSICHTEFINYLGNCLQILKVLGKSSVHLDFSIHFSVGFQSDNWHGSF